MLESPNRPSPASEHHVTPAPSLAVSTLASPWSAQAAACNNHSFPPWPDKSLISSSSFPSSSCSRHMGISCDTLLRSTSGRGASTVVNRTPAARIPPCESPDNTAVGAPLNTADVGKLALLFYNACKIGQRI